MEKKQPRELILKILSEKVSVKEDVLEKTVEAFAQLKSGLKEFATELNLQIGNIDKRIHVEFHDKGEFEAELRVGADVLIFHMHTNVFEFDKSHSLWKTSYIKEDNTRTFCGLINVYNFLTDSFTYNRINDLGYLIARIFINKESHYFVEGKRQLGFLYNDLAHSILEPAQITAIVESAVLYCLDFDLLTPPYETVKEATVNEIQEMSNSLHMKTGKRLGFKFQADHDEIV